MTEHTKGPWHRNIPPASKYCIVFAGRNTHVAKIESSGLTPEEIEGNCNLIAAAPELLEALDSVKFCLELEQQTGKLHPAWVPILSRVQTAIKKAKGE